MENSANKDSSSIISSKLIISSNLENDIDILKQVISMELNTIDGINIQEKSLPKRANKTQLAQGREYTGKECPICSTEFSKKKIVQCLYCTRNCCDTCCFKERFDPIDKRGKICCQCEVLFLHWLMNDEFRLKQHMQNQALTFTDKSIIKVDNDIEKQNQRIDKQNKEKQNPQILKKIIRLSNLKKDVVKDEASIKKLLQQERSNETQIQQLQKQYNFIKESVQIKRQQQRREKAKKEQQQKLQRQRVQRQIIRKEEEQKVRLQFQKQKQALIQIQLKKQEEQRQKKLAEDKLKAERQLNIQQLTKDQKQQKFRQLQLLKARQKQKELQRLKKQAQQQAARREKQILKKEQEKQLYRQKMQALQRQNLRLKADAEERERKRLEIIEQQRRQKQQQIRKQQQQKQQKRIQELQIQNQRLKKIKEQKDRIREEQEEKQRKQKQNKQKQQKQLKAKQQIRIKKQQQVTASRGSQSTSEPGKQDGKSAEKKVDFNIKNMSQMQILRMKIPSSARNSTISNLGNNQQNNRLSNPTQNRQSIQQTLNASGQTMKPLSKQQIFNRKSKISPEQNDAPQIDEKPKCACLLF